MVRVEAGPASVESEGQSSHGMAKKHGGVLESSKGTRVSGIGPIVDASNLDKPAKRCIMCNYAKLLVDFEDTVTTEDKRTDVCSVAYGNIEGYNVHAYIPTWIV
jgi:hypothetical protein